MSRPNYKEIIVENLDNIKEWASSGLTNKQIAKNLGMSESCYYKYKSTIAEFKESIKKGREEAIEELENTLFTSATGYVRKVKKYEKVKRCTYENGKKAEEWEEMVEYEEEEFVKPDTGAGIFLLKNWAKYMNEPKLIDLREKEIELKTKQIDAKVW